MLTTESDIHNDTNTWRFHLQDTEHICRRERVKGVISLPGIFVVKYKSWWHLFLRDRARAFIKT